MLGEKDGIRRRRRGVGWEKLEAWASDLKTQASFVFLPQNIGP